MSDVVQAPCPACHLGEMQVFHRAEGLPGNSCILLTSREEALNYPQGELELGFCPDCGFISNLAFDPGITEYSGRYEETQSFSSTFSHFHKNLAATLIERYQLHGKDIIEIGCGKGEFLQLLCELGDNRGIGFDPGVKPDRIHGPGAGQMQLIADLYSDKYAHCEADFLVCKMTLEHIPNVGEFIATLRQAIGQRVGTRVFFQVPEASRIFGHCAFEDIFYEHCSYFSPGSLARLFRANDFEVLRLSTEYDDQYLTLEARACAPSTRHKPFPEEDDIHLLEKLTADFTKRLQHRLKEWSERLQSLAARGHKAIIWGAQSKAVALLATVPEARSMNYGVDINPHRQGHYLPGSGMAIVAPAFLADYRPDLVIIMNPIYKEEISQELTELGLTPDIVTL